MPPTASTLRVGRYFLSLFLILAVLYGLVFLPGQAHKPKLGLDLVGGAQLILKARTENGKTPTTAQMRVAREILTQRVNGSGVAAAEVVQQGANRIVISVPGETTEANRKLESIGKPAALNFRPLIVPPITATVTPSGTPTTTATTGAKSTPTSATTGAKSTPSTAAKTPTTTSTTAGGLVQPRNILGTTAPAIATPTAAPSATATSAAASAEEQNPFTAKHGITFPLPQSDTAYAALTQIQQQALFSALSSFKCGSKPADVATADLAACDAGGREKFLLGPVIVAGRQVSSARAVAPDSNNVQWSIAIDLKSAGQTAWADYTQKHHSTATSATVISCSASTTPCAEFVAFTLDGDVLSTPHNEATINGTTSVTGSFTSKTANELADELKFGALPLTFDQETAQTVSATLGTSQLKAGLLAGGIGLALVVLYSMLYYRGLGFVTIASLLVSAVLTWACLVILGREIGFTLTLSGIAGFIVAVGITADSFVVFFERLKDEVHGGRSIRVAVPRAWARARRTIVSADIVSLLAATVLYYFAAGDVRGFAFTLGLSTVLDLVVVFLFTHPLVSLLSRSRAFGSPRFTGLNAVRTLATPALPDDEAPVGGSRRISRADGAPPKPSSSVALLEPETEVDGSDDELTEGPAVGSDEAEQMRPAKASKRSRVVPRVAPADIGASAAERAAARRGRTVRPPKEPDQEPIEDELEDDPTAPAQAPPVDDPTAAPAVEAAPAAEAEPAVETDVTEVAEETPESAATARAAARRARIRDTVTDREDES